MIVKTEEKIDINDCSADPYGGVYAKYLDAVRH